MADTVINPVEKCQQPEWAGMLAAGMLQWPSPLLRNALSCSLLLPRNKTGLRQAAALAPGFTIGKSAFAILLLEKG